MVRQFPNNKLTETIRSRISSIIERLGATNFFVYKKTETLDPMGKVEGSDEVRIQVVGVLEVITAQDKLFNELGILNIGDAVFYTDHDVEIKENNELQQEGDSFRWKFTKLVEAQRIGGDQVFQAWAVTKKV